MIAEHDPEDFIYDPSFFEIECSSDLVFVQMTLVEGRTIDQKRDFYRQVTDDLKSRPGIRPEDVFISLVGTCRDDGSFGKGEASLVKEARLLPLRICASWKASDRPSHGQHHCSRAWADCLSGS